MKKIYNENRDLLRKIEKTTMNIIIPIWATLFVWSLIIIAGTEKTWAVDVPIIKNEPTIAESKIEVSEDIKTLIKYNGRSYAVQIFADRVQTMKNMWLSDTRILDLLAIMNMECWSYQGNCFNWNDIWPMQINKVHKEQYLKSWEYYNGQDWGGLFKYQIEYANRLVQSYEDRFCWPYIFDLIWKQYTNKKRWECVWKSYNWHPRYKYAYVDLWWLRREEIKKLIYKY